MLSILPPALATLIYLTLTSALPADHTPPRNSRALLPASNSSLTPFLHTPSLVLPFHEPWCFIDAFIPIITPNDCLYTDHAISTDTRTSHSMTLPITWEKGKRWRYGSCAIAVVPNAQSPRDEFSRLDILTQAHRVLEKCENAPYGFRGGVVEIGDGEFQVVMKRPSSDIHVW